jgi:hypothetical protein
MTTKSTPKEFKCYLCEKIYKNKDIGASVGNSLIPHEVICEKCVHANYSWATDKDLTQHNYSEIESRRQELIENLQL